MSEIDDLRVANAMWEKVADGWSGQVDNLKATNANLLEALEYFVQNVIIDKYDACDEPLNTAWDKAREAIRKAKS